MQKGKLNNIADVKGVSVGHATLDMGSVQTGVTVIHPTDDNPYINKLPAASYVINGFGKTAGLIQIDELGQLESPIALTNTLCVGRVHDALVDYMIESCQEEGEKLETINVVVAECNDSTINDITNKSISKEHVYDALDNATRVFAQGAVGAGRGMVCHGLKGGIGTASRLAQYQTATYTVGTLVLANHGLLRQLTIEGRCVGEQLEQIFKDKISTNQVEKGSIIVILATDAPLDARQLKRLAKRATAGIARVGSEFGNGSGDVVIAFSTANRITHYFNHEDIEITRTQICFTDSAINPLFSATVEAVEESIINALTYAEGVGQIKSYSSALSLLGE